MSTTSERRSTDRVSDPEWTSTMNRVRAEFDEMPCLRVTREQARSLFGLSDSLSEWVLNRLAREGFLESRNGEYARRHPQP
jgi:hypothetical protein